MDRILVFTATYNEADNIVPLVEQVFEVLPDADMLVVDDASPDGTGRIADELKLRFPRLHVVHRPGKNGLGTAHKLAIKYALAEGYDALITMDADFSHHPKYLPEMVQNLERGDFVIGSRFVPGGSCEYPLPRVALSVGANTLTRNLLHIPLRETTTAYRGFRRALLERMNIDAVRSDGYSFFVESIFQVTRLERAAGRTHMMREFPIRFEDRRAGSTKISKKEIANGVKTLGRLALGRLLFRADFEPPSTAPQGPACEVCGCAFRVEDRDPARGPKRARCLGCGHVEAESSTLPGAAPRNISPVR